MAPAAVQQPASAQVVGNAFVQHYYSIQHESPGLVHRYYQAISKLGRPDGDGAMKTTTTMKYALDKGHKAYPTEEFCSSKSHPWLNLNSQAIKKKILSRNYGGLRAEIKTADAQESYNGGLLVLVTGNLLGKDNMIQNFTQTFFLAPQEKGYFVLNDIFRYIGDIKHANGNQSSVTDIHSLLPPERDRSPVEENRASEQMVVPAELNGDEGLNTLDNGGVSVEEEEVPMVEVVNEEVPVAEVVGEAPVDSQVMDMKESVMPVSSPTPVPRRSPAKSQAQQVKHAQASAPIAETPVSSSEAADDWNNQEGEADDYSTYIKGLPMNATSPPLEDEFKKFGTIEAGGVQVRNNNQGFCFGLEEFEVESAVQKAIETSQAAAYNEFIINKRWQEVEAIMAEMRDGMAESARILTATRLDLQATLNERDKLATAASTLEEKNATLLAKLIASESALCDTQAELSDAITEAKESKSELASAKEVAKAAFDDGYAAGFTKANRQCQRMMDDRLDLVYKQGFLAGLEADNAAFVGATLASCPEFPGPQFEDPPFADSEDDTGEAGTEADMVVVVEESDEVADADDGVLQTKRRSSEAEASTAKAPATTERIAEATQEDEAEAPFAA